MAKKIRDIAVRVGEYQDGDGKTKGRYQNVGALMKGDDGNIFILLARWFNPAGVQSDRETVLLSCFESKRDDDRERAPSRRSADIDDEIPF